MVVNPVVDVYAKTLNQRKILGGVLLIFNQLNMVLKSESSPKNFFLCSMLSLK